MVYALLDGPSVTGAFRIGHARSAAGLVQDIEAQLHFRKAVGLLGLAPLTSMYWYGPSDRAPADDWRPQIHDSDGLSIWTGPGERIWRPLANPPRVMANAFLDTHPRGFGLMQRDRDFSDYQDDGAFYEKRPSAWVEPVGDWGRDRCSWWRSRPAARSDDNIVAFWTPASAGCRRPEPRLPLPAALDGRGTDTERRRAGGRHAGGARWAAGAATDAGRAQDRGRFRRRRRWPG